MKENDEFLLEKYPPPDAFVSIHSRTDFYTFTHLFFPIRMTFIKIHGSGMYLQFAVHAGEYRRHFSFLSPITTHLDPIML